jgi:hypothetical protein
VTFPEWKDLKPTTPFGQVTRLDKSTGMQIILEGVEGSEADNSLWPGNRARQLYRFAYYSIGSGRI